MEHKPTPQQAAIIEFVRDNPETNLMINAVAGAAKTSTMVMAASAIGLEHSPLAVAFNKKIAVELESRLPSHFTCKTLNAIGHGAWQRARGTARLQLDADKLYKITKEINVSVGADEDAGDKFAAVLALARGAKSVGLVPEGAPRSSTSLVPDTLSSWEDIAFGKGLDISADDVTQARKVLLRSIDKAFKGEIDFDDQIYMSVMFGGVFAKHHTVIVDESQDLSPMNHIMLRRMTATRLIAVGDPYQAIYAFRGADAQSMANLAEAMGSLNAGSIGKGKFHELTLTNSFRVPKVVGARQRDHVPHFNSMDFLPEGEFLQWPLPCPTSGNETQAWSVHSVPKSGAILCRNNAPLLRLAFAFIKERIPVNILGRDIGASLASTLLKITGKASRPVEECYAPLEEWKAKEVAKADGSESKLDVVYDRYESLHVLLDASEAKDNLAAADFIRNLFSDKQGPMTTFSSIHRSKGLEWDWVMILDPDRCPAPWAYKQAQKGNTGPLEQERNLAYVGETRSKHTLIHANLDDCLEVGQ